MKNKLVYLVSLAPLASFAQDAGVPDVAGDITSAVTSASTVAYTVLGLSVAIFTAKLIMSFARKGKA